MKLCGKDGIYRIVDKLVLGCHGCLKEKGPLLKWILIMILWTVFKGGEFQTAALCVWATSCFFGDLLLPLFLLLLLVLMSIFILLVSVTLTWGHKPSETLNVFNVAVSLDCLVSCVKRFQRALKNVSEDTRIVWKAGMKRTYLSPASYFQLR